MAAFAPRLAVSNTDTLERTDPRPAADLMAMLGTRRPHNSKSERRWIREWLLPLGVEPDGWGNLVLRIGTAPILWSCHTDTVHRDGGTQEISVSRGLIGLSKKEMVSNCLGADCTTGAWLMREMILAGVEGLYIFHRAEEIGGHGSDYIATTTPELLVGIMAAIAFDRYGTKSVITHQAGGRCASDAFANSLGAAIGLGMGPDDGGTFTDTANYTDLIGECTNVSVGYDHQHFSRETQDLAFALTLRLALLSADFSTLVFKRQPGEVEARPAYSKYGRYTDHFRSDWDYDNTDERDTDDAADMAEMIRDNPVEVAAYLRTLGLTSADLSAEIWQRGGIVTFDGA